MTDQTPVPVFDGHNDALLRLLMSGSADPARAFLDGAPKGHLDFPKAHAGNFAGGFFAIFPPPVGKAEISPDGPQAPELARMQALDSTIAMASILARIERASEGRFAVCRSAGDIESAMARDAVAALFHIEGAEAIDTDLAMLDVLYAAGLRSLGLVWSRPNAFAFGVPFRFPSTPDIGPGLTGAGKALVKACNTMKILVDLSHLNEAGFRDVAALSDAPLVATHSNVHAICPHSRNLTAWQLDAIRDSGGVVGLNFAVSFLREDGGRSAATGLDVMIRHLDAMLEALGADGVGFGSDFDGAVIPSAIGDASGLPRLIEAMRRHGYGRELIEKIAFRNWIDLLRRTIG